MVEMVEQVGRKPKVRLNDGKWTKHNDLFGGPHYQQTETPEITTLTLPTFTVNDLCYLGRLLISSPSLSMLECFGVPVDPQARNDLASYLKEVKGVDLEAYFDPKREKNSVEKKIQLFANSPLAARQAVFTNDPNAALILEPILQLSSEELQHWHHIIHNDCALKHLI